MDQAFLRRFNAIIQFPMPRQTERLALWNSTLPLKASFAEDIDIKSITAKYKLSGSAIVNIIHNASLQTIYKNSVIISKHDIMEGIKREFEKEEKAFVG